MIDGNFDFRGFDAVAWNRLLSVVRRATHRTIGATLVVTVDGSGESIGAFHTGVGRIDGIDQLEDLAVLCEQHQARRCIVMDEHVLTELGERASLRVDPEDDYLAQWLTVVRAARELKHEGRLRVWPDKLASWPLPSAQLLSIGASLVLPNGKSIVLALFDSGELWTSAVLRRQDELIDLLVGPEELKRWVGPLGGAWRRDHRVICQAIERHVAPVHLGIFAEADTANHLLTEHTPGRFATAVTTRDVIVNPSPPWLSLLLGAEGLLGIASTWTQLLMGLDAEQARDYLRRVLEGFADDKALPDWVEWEPVRLVVDAIKASTAPTRRDAETDNGGAEKQKDLDT